MYWTAFQTEWATDVCFDSPASLQAIYRPLIRGAMTALSCDDILRFMNKRRSFQGEVDANLRRRERARITSRVSYRLRLLRTHGLIRKVKGQRRCHVTPKGRKIASALLVAQTATLQQLNALAA